MRCAAPVGLALALGACAASTESTAVPEEPALTAETPTGPQEAWAVFAVPHPVDYRWYTWPKASRYLPAVENRIPPGGGVRERGYQQRHERREPDIVFASDFSGAPLRSSFQTDSGWFHLAVDGTVYRSSTQAGPLDVVTEVPVTARIGTFEGALIGVSRDGQAWILEPDADQPRILRDDAVGVAGNEALFVLDRKGALHVWLGERRFEVISDSECIADLIHQHQGAPRARRGQRLVPRRPWRCRADTDVAGARGDGRQFALTTGRGSGSPR